MQSNAQTRIRDESPAASMAAGDFFFLAIPRSPAALAAEL